jgi:hypothetical protein
LGWDGVRDSELGSTVSVLSDTDNTRVTCGPSLFYSVAGFLQSTYPYQFLAERSGESRVLSDSRAVDYRDGFT